MTATTTDVYAEPADAPAGTIWAYNEPNGGDSHLCVIEGWNMEDGEHQFILRFFAPWTTEGGYTIFPFYEGVPGHRLSKPDAAAIFEAENYAEKVLEDARHRYERAMEDIATAKADLAKFQELWNED